MDKNTQINGKADSVTEAGNFIHDIIDRDLEEGVYGKRVHTRFPPEPNGYLHIGHAKSICLNFETANKYRGKCNLRFDDTNPLKEDVEYIESIKENIRWLGYDWEERIYYASDYFDQLYEYAVKLIQKGKAYVCELNQDEIREYRGTLTEPGKESPYRNRPVDENIDLFNRMREGEFEDGAKVLRAKIDMASPNLNMRDPVMYRISHSIHHRTWDKWCIYPMYDYAHPLSDAVENITHSICTLEFADHRPLYDWFLRELEFLNPPKQIEFARMELTNTLMSKRKLKKLVDEGIVDGWDDPRMPTIAGVRRRGYTPESIKDFCERIGVAKRNSVIDIALLEHCIREELNTKAQRIMAVLKPLKIVLTNYPEDKTEYFEIENNQERPELGTRKVPFSRILYIEGEDFMEDPPKKFFRLAPGKEVRLKNAYFVKCEEVVRDKKTGEILELRCTYDPETKSGSGFTGRKVKGTLHWVSAAHAVKAKVRLYDHLFIEDDINEMKVNSKSLEVLESFIEPSITEACPGQRYQFLRQGYFYADHKDWDRGNMIFNRIVSLKSSFKINK